MAAEPVVPQTPLDRQVARVGLYARAIIGVGAVLAGSAGLFVRAVTSDVKAEIREVRMDLRAREVADSVRFERIVEVVEYAVIAIVEPATSEERAMAIAELKRRRRVAP
jgi:hypothetical protein